MMGDLQTFFDHWDRAYFDLLNNKEDSWKKHLEEMPTWLIEFGSKHRTMADRNGYLWVINKLNKAIEEILAERTILGQ